MHENANTPRNRLGYQNSNYQNCIFWVYTQPFGIQCHISKCHVVCWCWTSQFYRPDKMVGSLYSLHIFIWFWHVCFWLFILMIRSTYVQELDQGNMCRNPYMYLYVMYCQKKQFPVDLRNKTHPMLAGHSNPCRICAPFRWRWQIRRLAGLLPKSGFVWNRETQNPLRLNGIII